MTVRFTPRPDAMAKLTGALVYLADRAPPGTLHGALLRSPHPHALIRAIDVTAARALPGVHAVVTAADTPQGLRVGIRLKDQPILADGRVRYVGEPIAAVAADDAATAQAALAAIRITYEPLPLVDDPEAALAAGAPPLHERGNLCHATRYERGALNEAFARSAHIVEAVYETPRQVHAALELEGAVAIPGDDGRLTVLAGSQHPHGVRDVVAGALGWSPERIDVVGSPIGGGYGAKEDFHVQPVVALLAAACGRPVRLVVSRPDNIDAGMKRHVFRIRMRTGCNSDGRLTAHAVDALADTGAYASHGPEVLETAHECADGIYSFDAVRFEGRLAYTNNGISGAFRGFGALQMQVALELQIDRLARRAGLDPVAFRAQNLRPVGVPGSLGQQIFPQPELVTLAERLAAHPLRGRPVRADPRYLSGTGVALISKGEGFAGGGPNGADGRLALSADGVIELRTGLTEMGQGLGAASAALLAHHLGLDVADVRGVLGDTRATPDSGPTSASRGTQIAARLVRAGAAAFIARVIAAAAAALDAPADEFSLGPGGIYRRGARANAPSITLRELAARGDIAVDISVPPIETHTGAGSAHTLFTACGALARVNIDRWTGQVAAEHIVVMPACGPVLVPEAFQGQVEGGAAMALGFALMESLPARGGRFVAHNLDQYLVPTIRDMPPVEVVPIEELDPADPVGIRGVGEIAINAVGPALATAVFDALGEAPTRLPVDAAWVLAVLDRERAS